MEIEQLREFVALTRTMNFTKTAQELNLSQPALSNHIMKIEKELGVTLITRSPTNPALSLEGSLFLETATSIINAYDHYLENVRKAKEHAQMRFAVQTLQHVNAASFTILQRVREFMRMKPEAHIDVHESLEFNTLERIARGDIDCGYYGVHLSAPDVEGDVDIVPLTTEELILWVDKTSPLATAETITPGSLSGAVIPFWVGSSNDLETIYREFITQYNLDAGLSPRFCSSREDFFLNRVKENDVVLLTQGAEDIGAVKVRDERVMVSFTEPIYVHSYMAFGNNSNETLNEFKAYVADRADPHRKI